MAGLIALNNITWKFFLVLIISTAVHWFNVFFLFPETKQRGLEDINLVFGERVVVKYYGATEEDEKAYAHTIEEEEDALHGIGKGAGEALQVEKV